MKQRSIQLHLEYVDRFGDHTTAIVASNLHYWYLADDKGKSKLRVVKDNSYWLVKTCKDWEIETRLSKKQVSKALGVLVAEGVIEVKVLGFKGVPCTHIRVLKFDGKTPMKKGDFICDIVPKGNNGKLPKVTMESDQRELSNTSNTTSNTTSIKNLAIANANAGGTTPEILENQVGEDMKYSGNATDIMKQFDEAKEIPPINMKDNWAVWRHYFQMKFDVPFMKPPTGKELGQLKQLRAHFGEEFAQTLEYMNNHWYDVCVEVKAMDGVITVPKVPNLGFVLKYAGTIKSVYLLSKTKVIKTAPKLNSSSNSITKPQKVGEVPMTEEEALAKVAEDMQEKHLDNKTTEAVKSKWEDTPWTYQKQ